MAAAKTTKPQETPQETPQEVTPTGQNKAEEVAELKAKLTGLESENDTLKKDKVDLETKLEAAKKEIASNRQKLESKGQSSLGDLGKDSYELRESVTIADSEGTTVTPRRGDVVTMLSDIKGIDAKVGAKVNVYRVSKATVDELLKDKLLRV